jgi:hypothetical protein
VTVYGVPGIRVPTGIVVSLFSSSTRSVVVLSNLTLAMRSVRENEQCGLCTVEVSNEGSFISTDQYAVVCRYLCVRVGRNAL